MAGSIGRSISIGLSANTKNFAKSLRSAEKNLQRFKNGVKVLGTAVAASFAAMGAAALLFGKSAISAALEDQKSQVLLARTIKNNAKARKGLIKDSEATITAYRICQTLN
jgi:predicted histidine transporter YuiF (NhaC family)